MMWAEGGGESAPNRGVDYLDHFLMVFSHSQRRQLLYHLREHEVVDIDEAVELVDRSGGGDASSERETIRIEMHHNHIPRLKQFGLIDYDQRTETIRYTGCPDELDEVIERIRGYEQLINS